MTVYYAPGGGRGHVTRARRVLSRLGIEDAVIVGMVEDSDVVTIPRELEGDVEGHVAWLRGLVRDHLIADTFPAGIQGELCGINAPRIDYVARLLRWDVYRKAVHGSLFPRFVTTYIVEELTAEHDAFVRANSNSVIELDLHFPAAHVPSVESPYWLIVHSGPDEEVRELVAYTSELRAMAAAACEVLVATPCALELPAGFRRVDAVPATHLYGNAEHIITAGGFNVMLETEPWRNRHTVLPFPRRFDDQFLRAARRARKRNATASGS